uniref:Uncharacterized protein n=1 Tax=Cuerna arida TaxID=1464854 RepID=A0A1B6FWC2_9HEMI
MLTRSSDISGSLGPTSLFEVTSDKKTAIQIKARDTQLQKELKALAKAEGIDTRSQQAKELQFRTKYEKYLTRGNFETSLLKKDVFKKVAQEDGQPTTGGLEHIPLHKLIYTKGEVDVEKVVCLHLLTVQQLSIPSLMDKRK